MSSVGSQPSLIIFEKLAHCEVDVMLQQKALPDNLHLEGS